VVTGFLSSAVKRLPQDTYVPPPPLPRRCWASPPPSPSEKDRLPPLLTPCVDKEGFGDTSRPDFLLGFSLFPFLSQKSLASLSTIGTLSFLVAQLHKNLSAFRPPPGPVSPSAAPFVVLRNPLPCAAQKRSFSQSFPGSLRFHRKILFSDF